MFSRLATLSMLALPLFAAATAVVRTDTPSTPTTACCASTLSGTSAAATAILGLLGISASDVNALVGLTCSPISIVGVGSGSACSGTTVSCSNGVIGSIGVGCIPISV